MRGNELGGLYWSASGDLKSVLRFLGSIWGHVGGHFGDLIAEGKATGQLGAATWQEGCEGFGWSGGGKID